MKTRTILILLTILLLIFGSCSNNSTFIQGELKKWHTITISFQGPQSSEDNILNPFTNYRLIVTFKNKNIEYAIPGFYAADGKASETGADSGNIWQVRFTPDQEGIWNYQVSFREGENIAVNDDPSAGQPVSFNGTKGSFKIGPGDKTGNDFRGMGRLQYVNRRYLKFAETGMYFLKGGAGSPENFLGYADFDGTRFEGIAENRMGEAATNATLHQYQNHISDWKPGDPTWKNGKGKTIIGALNYLASKGMNSVYFLTLNIDGDGKDVWPYTDYNERFRFDCSKLDQWEIVFSHMEKLGIMLHIVTQETENELLLDNGNIGLERKLYYRELISRFGHHLALTWNMGEENGYADFTPKAQNREQQMEMVQYIKEHDPYKHFTVIHTHAALQFRYPVLNDFLGFEYFDGPSLQISKPEEVHLETLHWVEQSKETGKPWVVCIDEIGPHWQGVDPDDLPENNQDSIRTYVLWANLMAGGAGVDWYFGYKTHNNDLNCEDWRSRDRMWDYTRYALDFFQKYLPFSEMEPIDELTDNLSDYCFVKKDSIYIVYLPFWQKTIINLSAVSGTYTIKWYNPRTGGELIRGSVSGIKGGSDQDIGQPPADTHLDWVAIIQKDAGQ
ncbi:MAG: DUF5060 domain-containing protein [Bacteroidales bacterium]|nr:DUF5060 domain-containing protein [Bacteroidales bacterium]